MNSASNNAFPRLLLSPDPTNTHKTNNTPLTRRPRTRPCPAAGRPGRKRRRQSPGQAPSAAPRRAPSARLHHRHRRRRRRPLATLLRRRRSECSSSSRPWLRRRGCADVETSVWLSVEDCCVMAKTDAVLFFLFQHTHSSDVVVCMAGQLQYKTQRAPAPPPNPKERDHHL